MRASELPMRRPAIRWASAMTSAAELFGRVHLLDESQLVGPLGFDQFPGVHQPPGIARPDRLAEPLGHPAPADPAGVAVTQSRRRGGDDQVAGQRQLDPTHARRAVHGRDDRFRHRSEEEIEVAHADEELAVGLRADEEAFGLRRVHPLAERRPGTGDHDDVHGLVVDGPEE